MERGDFQFCKIRSNSATNLNKTAIKYLEDGELLELSERVAEKLEAMTDEEFAGLEFVAAD